MISPKEIFKSTIPSIFPLSNPMQSSLPMSNLALKSLGQTLDVTASHLNIFLSQTDADWSLMNLIPQHPAVQQLFVIYQSTTPSLLLLCGNPARESGPTCMIILRAFSVLLVERVSLSVIHLPFLMALCEFHGLIWLFKCYMWAHGRPCSVWLSIRACLLGHSSLKSAFILCHIWFVGVSSPTSIFRSLVLSPSEVHIYYVVYSRYFFFSLTWSTASRVVLPSLQITF